MSDGYLRHHESGTMKRLKTQKQQEGLKFMRGSILQFVQTQNRTSASGNCQASQHSSSSCTVSVEDQDTDDVGGTMIHE